MTRYWVSSDFILLFNCTELNGTCEERTLVSYFYKRSHSARIEMTELLLSCGCSSDITSFHQRPHGKDPPAHPEHPGCCPATKPPCQQVPHTWNLICSSSCVTEASCVLVLWQQQVPTFTSTQTRSSDVSVWLTASHSLGQFQFLP